MQEHHPGKQISSALFKYLAGVRFVCSEPLLSNGKVLLLLGPYWMHLVSTLENEDCSVERDGQQVQVASNYHKYVASALLLPFD